MHTTRRSVLVGAGLVAATVLAFAEVRNHGFLVFDDDIYVTRNPHIAGGLEPAAVAGSFVLTYEANWFPLTWISHMVDVELFGLEPGPHHLTNVALHAANALLLLAALRALGAAFWPCAFVAALFALHPLRVESVAWVSERKDVLSGTFFMTTLWAWARYTRGPTPGRYAWVAVSLALGLMAKPMLVTLPFVLLLLDFWPLGRFERLGARRLVLEKLPLLPLVLVSCLLTIWAQRGAVADIVSLPLAARLANAALAVAWYVTHTLWPQGLAVFYPHPALVQPESFGLASPSVVAAAAGILAATLLAWRTAGRWPYLVVGWLWFLGMLAPVLGIVQVGEQARADRYAYLPTIGLALAGTWALRDAFGSRPRGRALLALAGGVVLIGCFAATRRQVTTWSDSVVLFERALSVTQRNYVAHSHLGVALLERGELDRARQHMEQAVRIAPFDAASQVNLAWALARSGDASGAEASARRAVALRPELARAHNLLGLALSRQGRLAEAEASLERALALDPRLADAHNNLGAVRFEQGRLAEAAQSFAAALRWDPGMTEARINLDATRRLLGAEAAGAPR